MHIFRKMFSFFRVNPDSGGAAIILHYPAIKAEWFKIIAENYKKALNDYPSKHLLEDEEEWQGMVEKQNDYASILDNASWIELKNRYDFSEKEWGEIKNNLLSDLLTIRKN